MSTYPIVLQDSVQQALTSSSNYLFSVLRPDGSWQDHVASSAVAVSTALCALNLADQRRFAAELKKGCAWLRETQHADGGWGDAITDASSLNATSLSLATLKMVEPDASEAAIQRALGYIEARGGYAVLEDPKECTMSVACQGYLALAGLYPWERMTKIPLALVLLPKRFWMRFSITMPGIFSWALIQDHKLQTSFARRWLRKLARPKVMQWIESARGVNGSWEDSPLLTGIVLLGLLITEKPYESVAPALDYLLATQRENGSWPGEEDLELSVTTFILGGLAEVDLLGDSRLEVTRDWLLASQHADPFSPTGCPGGWWSWRLPSGWPDTDDTCGAITSLRQLGVPATHPQLLKGCEWLCNMQNRDGSWGMFVKDCHAPMDEPCPGLTARVILALHNCREVPQPERSRYTAAIERALGYLQRVQREDGAFDAIWYKTLVYGTGIVLEMYSEFKEADSLSAQNCRGWLLKNQRSDGSWGQNAQEPGTVEETAWALSALSSTGVNAPANALDRAAAWLVEQQHAEGHWSPSVIGYYARALLYSSDHIANGFALRALGRYKRQRATSLI